MKKLFVLIAACVVAFSASAQGWQAGLRIGSGFQAVGAYEFSSQAAIEARFGMHWYYGTPIDAEFQVLYYKNAWEGSKNLFLDWGVGVELGGRSPIIHYGVVPSIKFGYKFSGAPIKLAIDWSPIIGCESGFGDTEYFTRGLANVGISCVYCF